MADNIKEDEGDGGVYVYKAPDKPPPSAPADETGGMIGALVACVIIVAVLVFLWKLLERKRKDMEHLQEETDVEHCSSDEDKLQSPTSPDPHKPHASYKALAGIVRSRRSNPETELPGHVPEKQTMSDKASDQLVPLEELVLPNISPEASSEWGHQGEVASGDTGYNSGFYMKDTGLRRRVTEAMFDPLDLDMENPRCIVESLKRDRQLVRKEMEERSGKVKEAIKGITRVEELLMSSRKRLNNGKPKRANEVETFLRKRRQMRERRESARRAIEFSYAKQNDRNRKDAFLAMQMHFEGLPLRPQVREIAEEVFLLREEHKSDQERNKREKEFAQEAIRNLAKCGERIRKAQCVVKHVKQAMTESWEKRLAARQERHNDVIEETAKVEPEVKEPITSSKFRIKLPLVKEIFKSKDSRKLSPEDEKCAICRKRNCECKVGNKIKDEKSSTAAPLSQFTNIKKSIFPTSKSYDLETAREERKGTNNLTLKLIEVTEDGCSDVEKKELTEREVKKALNRVPFVTSVKTIAKGDVDNEWVLNVASTQPRLANVRFSCRGRTYVIGMLG